MKITSHFSLSSRSFIGRHRTITFTASALMVVLKNPPFELGSPLIRRGNYAQLYQLYSEFGMDSNRMTFNLQQNVAWSCCVCAVPESFAS